MGDREIETRSIHPNNNNKNTYVSIQLPDKAGEVAVLEVFRQKICLKLGDIPDHKTVIAATPRHH